MRQGPYGAFNFLVQFGDVAGGGPIDAGFSDVSGLGNEINYSEYREGDFKVNTPTKVPNTHKLDEVTLKRGLIGSTDIFTWLARRCATAPTSPAPSPSSCSTRRATRC